MDSCRFPRTNDSFSPPSNPYMELKPKAAAYIFLLYNRAEEEEELWAIKIVHSFQRFGILSFFAKKEMSPTCGGISRRFFSVFTPYFMFHSNWRNFVQNLSNVFRAWRGIIDSIREIEMKMQLEVNRSSSQYKVLGLGPGLVPVWTTENRRRATELARASSSSSVAGCC